MKKIIGIRYEDKYVMERRVPLIPIHVRKLVMEQGVQVYIETSAKRVYEDEEFEQAGAHVTYDLQDCPVIFGVKEIPIAKLEPEKTYIFFAHVIKGQPHNMQMLRRLMELKCNLIDYERVVDEMGKRLIFFGRYAGLAGMINSLWSLGERLREFGIETPLLDISQARTYYSLDEARRVVSKVGQKIIEKGLPPELKPVVIGITGYGNVSLGAQEILSLLPVKELLPEEVSSVEKHKFLPDNILYKVVFKEKHIVEPVDPSNEFELTDYYQHPEKYRSKFEQYIPHLNMLVNGIYWDARYPRLVTKDYAEQLFKQGKPKLTVIGDISCDPNGSIEMTDKGTEIENPVFVYNPFTRQPDDGFKGEGLLIMAVDILPSELPRDASKAFSEVLWKFVSPIASADFDKPFESIRLPGPVKRAMILHKGELTPDYTYISKYLG
ncbi:MAG: bifunctional lysine ketoglutarate reductase /saccharopine dehydrogenase family protein [Bacteroidetes bacterium]|nr:bifunctional lysine ketoglutarate reductase /saccharopine dehydrogenase family protein [Bacteroidota bacterium]